MASTSSVGPTAASNLPNSLQELLVLCDEQFVEAVYRTVLGREADASGRSTYTTMLRAGAEKAAIVVTLALSTEGQQKPRTLDGLGELLAARAPRRRSLLSRLAARMRRAETARNQETQRLLRTIENQVGRLEARLDAQSGVVAELRSTLAQVSISVDSLRVGTGADQISSATQDHVAHRQIPPEVDRMFHRLRHAVSRRLTRVER